MRKQGSLTGCALSLLALKGEPANTANTWSGRATGFLAQKLMKPIAKPTGEVVLQTES